MRDTMKVFSIYPSALSQPTFNGGRARVSALLKQNRNATTAKPERPVVLGLRRRA